jgi:hypothetical protein
VARVNSRGSEAGRQKRTRAPSLKRAIQKFNPSLQAPKGNVAGPGDAKPRGDRSAAFQSERLLEPEKFLEADRDSRKMPAVGRVVIP